MNSPSLPTTIEQFSHELGALKIDVTRIFGVLEFKDAQGETISTLAFIGVSDDHNRE